MVKLVEIFRFIGKFRIESLFLEMRGQNGGAMTDFLGYKTEPISKGWSVDQKFCAIKADGTKYLLRISPIERLDAVKNLFEILKSAASAGIFR